MICPNCTREFQNNALCQCGYNPHNTNFIAEFDNDTECPICHEPMAPNPGVTTLPCGHVYDTACIIPWITQNPNCPYCMWAIGPAQLALYIPQQAAHQHHQPAAPFHPAPPMQAHYFHEIGAVHATDITGPPPRINWEGRDLRNLHLAGANLQNAILRNTNLSDMDLRGVNLEDADLRGADLRNADLRGARLAGSLRTGANMQGANMQGVIYHHVHSTQAMRY